MNVINGIILSAVILLSAGCYTSGQKVEISAAEHVSAKRYQTSKHKSDVPKLGWKGANGSDYLINQ